MHPCKLSGDEHLQRRRADVYDNTENGEVPPGLPKLKILRRNDPHQKEDPDEGKLPPLEPDDAPAPKR